MKRLLPLLLVLCFVLLAPAWAATTTTLIVTFPAFGLTNVPLVLVGGAERFSDYTNRPNPLSTDLVLLADPVNHTNIYVTWSQLLTAAATGGSIVANPWDTNGIPVSGVASNSVFTGTTTNSTTYFTNQTSGALAGFGAGGLLESISLASSLSLSGTTLSVAGANVTGLNAGNISSGTIPYSALPGVIGLLSTNYGSGLTNIPIVSSVDIPPGAWSTNGVDSSIASTITPAQLASVTNAGDGIIFSHTNGTSTITNAARIRFSLPWDWDGGTVKVGLVSVCGGTNSSLATNVVYAVRAVALGGADNLTNLTFGSFVRVTNNVGTNAWVQGSEGVTAALTVGNSPSSAKSILWEIQRHGGDSGDTETNANCFLDQFRIYYRRATRADFPTSSP